MSREPPDSGKGRHRDYSGREVTRPGVHVQTLDDTVDELTPVEHLAGKVATVEGVTADLAMTLAERYEMPSTEAWSRLVERMNAADRDRTAMSARVEVCEAERAHRAKWARVWTWAKGVGGGGVVAALVWAVTAVGDAGASREAAARDAAIQRQLVDDVRALREATAADRALIQVLLSLSRNP